MNKQFANRYLSLIQALARGETIQFQNTWGTWIDTETPEFNDWTHYRIKPTPVHVPYHVLVISDFYSIEIGTKLKRVLRPWTADEIPIGAYFKQGSSYTQRITGYDPKHANIKEPAILLTGRRWDWQKIDKKDRYFIDDLVTSITEPKYSWDGVTWHRCGIWEYKIVN